MWAPITEEVAPFFVLLETSISVVFVSSQVFVGRSTLTGQGAMVAEKTPNTAQNAGAVESKHDPHDFPIRGRLLTEQLHDNAEVANVYSCGDSGMDRSKCIEQQEEPVVPFPDAGPSPRTVVVMHFDARIAVLAVERSWRPKNMACSALLTVHVHALDSCYSCHLRYIFLADSSL